MRNKILLIFIIFFFNQILFAENLQISAKNISIDNNKKTTIFNNEVSVLTSDNDVIKSDFAEYNKDSGVLTLKKNIILTDKYNNILTTNFIEFKEKENTIFTKGPTKIITSEKYILNGNDLSLDKNKNLVFSNNKAIIIDNDNNEISLNNFRYNTKFNFFKSIGDIKIKDVNNNTYKFTQIYIDTKKKEIVGTDIQAYLDQKEFKIKDKNNPRVFANSLNFKKDKRSFEKSIFTLCGYRDNDKCPPWSIQSTKMLHDNEKKTIYYDNALLKIYNIPIFYFPKLSHPDPSVKRRSGFLLPSYNDTKNLGSSISIPYFFAINHDKNFTLTNKLYSSENPLFTGEYHQVFKDAYLMADFGHTEGYKDNNKKTADRSHFFSYFEKIFNNKNESKSTLSISLQDTSDDKYLKLYRIKSNLVDYEKDNLESTLSFSHEDKDLFVGLDASVYESLKETYNDKYEYILPELTVEKNLYSNSNFGNLDLQTNFKLHNYDTNKLTSFLINDFNFNYKDLNFESGLKGKILANVKNINYETKNIDLYKKNTTSELYGAIGYLSQLNLEKINDNSKHKLKPKILLRYSPNKNMRKESSGSILNPISAFSLNRLNNSNNYETGLSASVGLDYDVSNNNKKFDFSVAQIINEKENKKMPSISSLDEKISDLVISSNYELNDNFSLSYNGAIDQNYNDINYNDVGVALNLNPIKIDFNYLEENKHIGDKQYFKTKFSYEKDNAQVAFETKRNLVTNSAEFYNLSYEYINDCLRAGLVYRREFYKDSEIEPEDSLMFKITLIPFGNINTPSFNQ
jgi:LPS-assembly protein